MWGTHFRLSVKKSMAPWLLLKIGPTRQRLSDDPEVLLLARDGYDAFVLVTGQRILRDNRDRIVLNYCPRCGGLARTPKARQCRFCGKDWHNEIEG